MKISTTDLLMLGRSVVAATAQDTNGVGDHHQGCPMLVSTESARKDPGCTSREAIFRGDSFSLIRGSFSQHMWRKSVDETLGKDDVLTIRRLHRISLQRAKPRHRLNPAEGPGRAADW